MSSPLSEMTSAAGPPIALTDDLLTQALQFSTEHMLSWCSIQRVSKQFRRCALKPRIFSCFVLDLGRVELLSHLGKSVNMVCSLKLTEVTDAGLQALAPLVGLQIQC